MIEIFFIAYNTATISNKYPIFKLQYSKLLICQTCSTFFKILMNVFWILITVVKTQLVQIYQEVSVVPVTKVTVEMAFSVLVGLKELDEAIQFACNLTSTYVWSRQLKVFNSKVSSYCKFLFFSKGSVFYSQKDINLQLPLNKYWQWLPICTGCIKTECMYILCLMNLAILLLKRRVLFKDFSFLFWTRSHLCPRNAK